MPETRPTIALFAKFPRAGEVKTRLIPGVGAEAAAGIHRALVERTIATVRRSGLPLALYISGASQADFARWLGDDIALREQGEGDLGARLARVAAPAILLGADIPDLTAEHLRDAARALEDVPVVIGPAQDGGYYLLGFNQKVPFLFDDMAWGTDAVRAETQRRLEERGIAWCELDPLADCDRPEDLARWPELIR